MFTHNILSSLKVKVVGGGGGGSYRHHVHSGYILIAVYVQTQKFVHGQIPKVKLFLTDTLILPNIK